MPFGFLLQYTLFNNPKKEDSKRGAGINVGGENIEDLLSKLMGGGA